MKTLSLTIPSAIDIDQREALMAIASRLYENGKLSLGQAAELAGVSKRSFIEVLGNYGVSVFNHPSSELDRDITNAKSYTI
jgi:predicted HTH domain antitoxin